MKSTHKAVAAGAAALAIAAFALPAQAQVLNGDFESGNLRAWSQTGDVSFSGVDAFAARSGAYGAFFGPTEIGGITQSFVTLANTPYQVSFALSLADSAAPNSFSWTWNGVTQAPALNNAAAFGYTNFSGMVLATGTSSTIAFNFRNPQSFWTLDNVAVAAIPEPSEIALFAAGLALLIGKLKQRAKPRRTEEPASASA